jgi:hypothetical protein
LVFLDTKWVSRRVRKVFEELWQGAHNKSLKRDAEKTAAPLSFRVTC